MFIFATKKLYKLKLIRNLIIKSDTFGVLASALCIIHCFSTQFIIILSYNYFSTDQLTSVILWKNLDYFFLLISFIMVCFSSQTTSKSLMKYMFWSSWGLLFISIVNEKAELLLLPEFMTYTTALLLAGVHFYNLKYSQLKNHNIKDTSNE